MPDACGRYQRAPPSYDAYQPEHAAGLMLQDMAMEHPVAWIVRNERNFDALARVHHRRVLPFAVACRLTVTRYHPKDVTMQMHRMVPSRVVDEGQATGLVSFQCEEWIKGVPFGGNVVDRP